MQWGTREPFFFAVVVAMGMNVNSLRLSNSSTKCFFNKNTGFFCYCCAMLYAARVRRTQLIKLFFCIFFLRGWKCELWAASEKERGAEISRSYKKHSKVQIHKQHLSRVHLTNGKKIDSAPLQSYLYLYLYLVMTLGISNILDGMAFFH